MKIYNFAIPVFLAFCLTNFSTTESNYNSTEVEGTQVEMLESGENAMMKKRTGYLNGAQDFTNCNTCSDCTLCPDSDGGCIGATIEVTSLFCPFETPQGVLDFGVNNQYICTLTQTGPYEWYLEFNAVAYACNQPGIPFTFDIPMTYTYDCDWNGGGVIDGSINFIIC